MGVGVIDYGDATDKAYVIYLLSKAVEQLEALYAVVPEDRVDLETLEEIIDDIKTAIAVVDEM